MNYNEVLDQIIWSFSTLHQYEECPYAFYNRKIDRSEVDEGNYYADIGGFIHEIHEKIFNGALNVNDVVDYFMDNYDNNVVYETKQSTQEKKYNQIIDYFATMDLDRMKNFEILGVEKQTDFEINGHKFVGFIDLALRNKATDDILIVDHKSAGHFLKQDGAPLKSQVKNLETYSKQMYLYSKPIYEEYGKYPSKLIWNHFFEQKITEIPFDMKQYVKTMRWAENTIEKIYQDTEFQAKTDYMMCKIICGFRNSCCYANEEEA